MICAAREGVISAIFCFLKKKKEGYNCNIEAYQYLTIVILVYNCNFEAWRESYNRNFHCLPQMPEQLTAWIKRVAALNDSDLEEELKWVNKNSLNAFARAIGRIRRPELDSHP